MLNALAKRYTDDFYLVMDKSYFPYGNKPYDVLYNRITYLIDYLIDKGCNKIVIACNTLCTTVLEDIRGLYDIKLIGIIDIVIEFIKSQSIKSVSLIATTNTINSNVYQKRLSEINVDCNVINGDEYIYKIENRMDLSFDDLEIKDEYLILGCTHFINYKDRFNCKTISQDDLINISRKIFIDEIKS